MICILTPVEKLMSGLTLARIRGLHMLQALKPRATFFSTHSWWKNKDAINCRSISRIRKIKSSDGYRKVFLIKFWCNSIRVGEVVGINSKIHLWTSRWNFFSNKISIYFDRSRRNRRNLCSCPPLVIKTHPHNSKIQQPTPIWSRIKPSPAASEWLKSLTLRHGDWALPLS